MTPSLLSLNVGMPKDVSWQGRTVHTGVWKYPVTGPRMVRRLNIDGDGQGDLAGHGGEQRAVLVYQAQSHQHWREHFGRSDIGYGHFGENLTVDGLADDEVCIGDRYRIGDAEFEVTQPRVTCYRVGLRLGEPELPALMVGHHRPGFYMRVIREGLIQAGDEIVKTVRGPGGVTVADADALLYLPGKDQAKLRVAVDIPALSPGWRGSFEELLAEQAADAHAADAQSPQAAPAWPGFRPLRVTGVVPETATVTSVYLASADGAPLPAVPAGQYLTLRVTGAGTPAPIRSYSLSAAPGADRYRISVKREPHGTVSGFLTTALRTGAVLDAGAPRGDFVLDNGDGPILLISAGIGLTPVLAMLHALAGRVPLREPDDAPGRATAPEPGRALAREVWWIYGARSPDEYPLAGEVHGLLAALPQAREHVFYSASAGRLSKDKLSGIGIPTNGSAYICGPAAFMASMREALTELGVSPGRVHTELFGGLPSINPGIIGQERKQPHQPPGPEGTGPLVTFARSGISTRFPASAGNVLELAESCDVPARWSCRTGVCHTCVTPVVSGELTYSPDPLEPPPGGQALICCARPRTELVLDM
ncbi:MAG TPA: MOSC domain-containing protein [Trebonia sp.]|nr:MOSC domain-containing protein [Trebonia sp.]